MLAIRNFGDKLAIYDSGLTVPKMKYGKGSFVGIGEPASMQEGTKPDF